MKAFRLALISTALVAMSAAGIARATTTPTTYNFGSAPSSVSNTSTASGNVTTTTAGVTTFQNASSSQYGDGGTNYGNTLSWAGSTAGSSVTVSAWSTTGVGNTFEKAFIGNYSGDLGVTGQPRTGLTNAELNASNQPNTSNNQHAIDNVGAYDALLFSFASAVTLADVSIGFPSASSGLDSDSTILYWKGTGTPTSTLNARTVSDLTSNGWAVATNIGDMAVGNNATGLSSSISSQYWMVGAYMNIGGPVASGSVSVGNDYFKVNGLTAIKTAAVPEPDTLALFGIAGAALFVRRRKAARPA